MPASPASSAPSARPSGSTSASRRRQRSARVGFAVALVAVAALGVLAAILTGVWAVVVLAAVLAVVLGAAATRTTYSEVTETRREAARDRAEQAQGYRELTEVRTAEQAIYVAETQGRLSRHEATISRLEKRLAAASAEADEATAELEAQLERAERAERMLSRAEEARADLVSDHESETERYRLRLDDAEDRAAQAIVRVAELEHELDVLLASWHDGQRAPGRKHA